ncbi:DUF551 domain-containing protein [Citrobacter cronae]|uniref:DUF551 domain-containing protein n=1 Tax=Citrobacter cronae TaxID=1748967 RepID=UPI0023B27357|nr:DUF551 domain-containing protein [Citrobacter cronae]MDE9718838.1 DUF551 domain-containing protein [Citrobacter cronae]
MTTNNHPANGPVSLERLHQIRQYIERNNQYQNGGNRAYILADVLKVIDGAIAEFEEQDNPRPVMAVKGELGFIDNLEKIIEERDEDIDIGQLGRSNYDALMLAALDAFRASLPTPVVPEPKSYMDFWEQYPDMTAQEAIDRSAGWNACRSAMLQGSQPVSNRDELPLDYLQGHKDGLEWAAQLAEANHPQTGDWLYDDQTELAKAIRKGPDMPPVESGNSPVIPDGWQLVPKQITLEMECALSRADSYEIGWRLALAAAPTHSGTNDGWIPCSERMPTKNERVLIFINFNSDTVPLSIHDAQFTGSTFRRGNATVNVFPLEDGYGVTHWMPLPAAPQQEVKLALEHGMQRYARAMQKLSEGDK